MVKLACSYVQYVQHAIHPSASCQASRQSFTDLELEPLPFSFSRAEASSMRRQLAGHGTACCVTHTGRHQSRNLFITLALQKTAARARKGEKTYVRRAGGDKRKNRKRDRRSFTRVDTENQWRSLGF